MERVTKALLVLSIFLMAFFAGSEGARDVSTKEDKVYYPQGLLPGFGGFGGNGDGPGGDNGGHGFTGLFPWLRWFRFPFFPWLGGGVGGGGGKNDEAGLKDMAKGENRVREVPNGDGSKAGHGYP